MDAREREERERENADQPARCCCSSFARFGSARRRETRQFVASGSSRRVRGPRFRGRRGRVRARVARPPSVARRESGNTKTPRARHRCVVASFLEDGTHPPRTAFAVETRRVARLFAASMSMPSKPSVAFSYAGPPSRIIVAPRHARACFCRLSLHVHQLNLGTKLFFAASWRPLVSVTAATSDARSSSLPFAPLSSERRSS